MPTTYTPRHTRLAHPPRMRLTERDVAVVLAVYAYRVLRRDQIQRMFFTGKNTANERLKRLYQHGYLDRRWLPVEYGQGSSQALYLLAERGAQLVAASVGVDRAAIDWKDAHNRVRSPFLEHLLMTNEVRLALTLAARRHGYAVERWLDEETLKAHAEGVNVTREDGTARHVPLVPDGYFSLDLGDRRAHFFLEIDRATEANRRWADKVRAYQRYAHSGRYAARYQARSLRVLSVTTGRKRLDNLKRTTERAGGDAMFWFASVGDVAPSKALVQPVWHVAGQERPNPLIS